MNWQKVYSSKTLYQAEIVKSILEQNSLLPVVVNRKDSSYPGYFDGNCEVYVSSENVLKALKLIEDEIRFIEK
jgi:Zn-dependent membrane protease YugP